MRFIGGKSLMLNQIDIVISENIEEFDANKKQFLGL